MDAFNKGLLTCVWLLGWIRALTPKWSDEETSPPSEVTLSIYLCVIIFLTIYILNIAICNLIMTTHLKLFNVHLHCVIQILM